MGARIGHWRLETHIERAARFPLAGRATVRQTNSLVLALCLASSGASARWYDAESGRFLSDDPVGVTTQKLLYPTGLSPWLYANGGPTRFVDPDGKYGRDGLYGCEEYPGIRLAARSPRMAAACAAGGSPSTMEVAASGELVADCKTGNNTACGIMTGQGLALVPAALEWAGPVLMSKEFLVGSGAMSVLTLKHDERGGTALLDPGSAIIVGAFASAYDCGSGIADGRPTVLSCAMTGVNLALLGRASWATSGQQLMSRARPFVLGSYLAIAPLDLESVEVVSTSTFSRAATMRMSSAVASLPKATLPLGVLNPHPEMKIGWSLEGVDPDAMIHITPEHPNVLDVGTYWARLGDVRHLTPTEFRIGVVGPAAAGYSPQASRFAVAPVSSRGLFRRESTSALGYPEYINTEPVSPEQFFEVQPGRPMQSYREQQVPQFESSAP